MFSFLLTKGREIIVRFYYNLISDYQIDIYSKLSLKSGCGMLPASLSSDVSYSLHDLEKVNPKFIYLKSVLFR